MFFNEAPNVISLKKLDTVRYRFDMNAKLALHS